MIRDSMPCISVRALLADTPGLRRAITLTANPILRQGLPSPVLVQSCRGWLTGSMGLETKASTSFGEVNAPRRGKTN